MDKQNAVILDEEDEVEVEPDQVTEEQIGLPFPASDDYVSGLVGKLDRELLV